MPDALRIGPYRFFFWSRENAEPPHVHVKRDRLEAKFWLVPVEIAQNWVSVGTKLNRIAKIVEQNREALLEAWNGFFGQD